jgi:hypothetical protein
VILLCYSCVTAALLLCQVTAFSRYEDTRCASNLPTFNHFLTCEYVETFTAPTYP